MDLSKEIKKGSKKRFFASFRSGVLRCSGAPISAQVFPVNFEKFVRAPTLTGCFYKYFLGT